MSEITKRALENALKTLLLKKPLNKITISDVTEECGVNRMTFYYHFKDIYDLVEWCCLEDAGKALQDKKTYDTWEQGLTQIFYAVKENKPFIMNVYRCVSREQVDDFKTDKLADTPSRTGFGKELWKSESRKMNVSFRSRLQFLRAYSPEFLESFHTVA